MPSGEKATDLTEAEWPSNIEKGANKRFEEDVTI